MLRDAGPDLLEEGPEVVGGGGEDDLVRVEGGAAAARKSHVSHVAAPKELPVAVEPQQIFMVDLLFPTQSIHVQGRLVMFPWQFGHH